MKILTNSFLNESNLNISFILWFEKLGIRGKQGERQEKLCRKFDFQHSIQLISFFLFEIQMENILQWNSLVFEDAFFYLCKIIQKHLMRKLLAIEIGKNERQTRSLAMRVRKYHFGGGILRMTSRGRGNSHDSVSNKFRFVLLSSQEWFMQERSASFPPEILMMDRFSSRD